MFLLQVSLLFVCFCCGSCLKVDFLQFYSLLLCGCTKYMRKYPFEDTVRICLSGCMNISLRSLLVGFPNAYFVYLGCTFLCRETLFVASSCVLVIWKLNQKMILWLFNFVALFQISVLRLFSAHGPSKTTITPKPSIFLGHYLNHLSLCGSELSSFSSSGSYPFGFWAPVILNHKLIY